MTSDHQNPEKHHRLYQQEIALLKSAWRSGEPTRDSENLTFFGMPYDDFTEQLSVLRREIECRAYLAIVAAAEAIVQMDFRARGKARPGVLLRDRARERLKTAAPNRLAFEEVLDFWREVPELRREPVSEFKQLLDHRHWLAHGRYFRSSGGVPLDPEFAFQRANALFDGLRRMDSAFPRRWSGWA